MGETFQVQAKNIRTMAVTVPDNEKLIEMAKKQLLDIIKEEGHQYLGKMRMQREINFEHPHIETPYIINIAQDYCYKEDMVE